MLIELGGGTNPHPRAEVVIDPVHPRRSDARYAQQVPWDMYNDDGEIWSIEDDAADEVYASHVLEHIPKGDAIIKVFNEAWRVLRPGGTFTMIMPIIGYTMPIREQMILVSNWRPWADPTHVNMWWLPEGLHYFTGQEGADADYGIQAWQPMKRRLPEEEITATLASELVRKLPSPTWSTWGVRGGWEGYAKLVKP